MQINTHGFEVDENEHDVVDKHYEELTPRLNPSPMVAMLRTLCCSGELLSQKVGHPLSEMGYP